VLPQLPDSTIFMALSTNYSETKPFQHLPWKPNIVNSVNNVDGAGARKGKEVGSKILLTKLPVDITPLEVEVSY
jgi:hypothetical protein